MQGITKQPRTPWLVQNTCNDNKKQMIYNNLKYKSCESKEHTTSELGTNLTIIA